MLGNTTEALVPAGAVVTLSSAASRRHGPEQRARCREGHEPQAKVGSATGVGASFALQVIDGSTVRAEIENGAAVTGGAGLTIDAIGFRDMYTQAEGGTAGNTAVTPVVALVVSVDDDVTARIGTSATNYVGTGALVIRATHTLWVKTEGKAEAAGKSTAVGANVVVNAIVGWDTLAEIARNAQATSVEVAALSEALHRGQVGGQRQGRREQRQVRRLGVDGRRQRRQPQHAGHQGPDGIDADLERRHERLERRAGREHRSRPASRASRVREPAQQHDRGRGRRLGELARRDIHARITANVTVTATTGTVSVTSLFRLGANAFGVGSAIDLESDGTRVGATIGLNVQDAHEPRDHRRRRARHRTDRRHRAGCRARPARTTTSSSGRSRRPAARAPRSPAARPCRSLLLTTEASIGAGADIDAPAGGVTVDAAQPMRLQNLAISGALSTSSGAAIGGAFLVNYLEVTTRAWIDSSVALHDVGGRLRRDRGDGIHDARPARAEGAQAPRRQDRLPRS